MSKRDDTVYDLRYNPFNSTGSGITIMWISMVLYLQEGRKYQHGVDNYNKCRPRKNDSVGSIWLLVFLQNWLFFEFYYQNTMNLRVVHMKVFIRLIFEIFTWYILHTADLHIKFEVCSSIPEELEREFPH